MVSQFSNCLKKIKCGTNTQSCSCASAYAAARGRVLYNLVKVSCFAIDVNGLWIRPLWYMGSSDNLSLNK